MVMVMVEQTCFQEGVIFFLVLNSCSLVHLVMSQSGELINATLQCIGDSSDNVQGLIRPSDLVFRLRWHIWVRTLRHESLCRIWRITKPVTHQSDCKDSSDLCHHCGDSLQRDTNNMVGSHKAEGSQKRWLIRLQGPRSWCQSSIGTTRLKDITRLMILQSWFCNCSKMLTQRMFWTNWQIVKTEVWLAV